MSSGRREQIIARLQDKTAREAFVASRLRVRLPAQIRELRLSRRLRQSDVGGMLPSLISRYEQSGYEDFSLRTLRALAAAFDVGLKVQFVPFSELVADACNPDSSLDVPDFDNDWPLHERIQAPPERREEYPRQTVVGFTLLPEIGLSRPWVAVPDLGSEPRKTALPVATKIGDPITAEGVM